MTRLVLTVLSLVFITCVVADYDSNERENLSVSGEDDKLSNEKDSIEFTPSKRTAYIKNHETTSKVTLPSGKTAYIANHFDKLEESSQCGSETILLKLDPSDEEYKLMDSEMQSTIRSHRSMNFTKYNITKIERIINGCLMKVYKMRQEHVASQSKHLNERMLFYGTPYIDDIVANGFDERYTNIHGMFGAGLYFTEYSSKSNQYTKKRKDWRCMTCERKMIISRVTLGNIYKSKQAKRKLAHGLVGHHSVQGVASSESRGLKYDEYVIYRGDQAYPDYVITYNLIP